MKLRQMFIPYATIGLLITGLLLFGFGADKAKTFMVIYTIAYAAVMVVLDLTSD